MKLGLLKTMLGMEADHTVQSITDTIAAKNPELASAAELTQMQTDLDGLALKVSKARIAYDHSKAEYDQHKAAQDQRVQAIGILDGQASTETDSARKDQLTQKVNGMLALAEQQKPALVQMTADLKESHDFLTALEQSFQDHSTAIQQRRDQLASAQRDVQMAEHERDTAREKAEHAKQLAGLAPADHTSSVIDSMHRHADELRAETQAASLETGALKPAGGLEDDPDVKAALDKASGKASTPASVSDRLAALKG